MPSKMSPEYQRAYRARRKAAGNPIPSGSKNWSPEKLAAWKAAYYSRDDVKARKAEQMLQSSAKYPDRTKARRAVRSAIEAGKLVRLPCEVCNALPVHAHHDDYSKPLAVRWLCRKHHDQFHAKAKGE